MRAKQIKAKSSVATQQKSKYADLTSDQLHSETLSARNALYSKCVDLHQYINDVMVPYSEEVISRYKLQGVAAENRPNHQPTVEAYFKSIKLNYSTVRSWIRRKRLQTEMFKPGTCCRECKRVDGGHTKQCSKYKPPTLYLSALERKYLARELDVNDVLDAYDHGRDVSQAIEDLRKTTLTREQIEDYQKRPVEVRDEEIQAVKLCRLIEQYEKDCPPEIAKLAHQLLVQVSGLIKARTETELVNNNQLSPATSKLLRASENAEESSGAL